MREKRKYIDVNFYKVFLDLLKIYRPYYKNMDKDDKYTVGKKIFDLLLDCINDNINSYYEEDINKKYEISKRSYNNLLKIEVLIRYLNDLKILGVKQIAFLSQHTAEIKIQLNNWKNSLENKI